MNDEIQELEKLLAQKNGELAGTQQRLQESAEKLATAEARLATAVIDHAVETAALAAGVIPNALPDILAKGRSTFRVDEKTGIAVAYANGTLRYGRDAEPMQ